MFKILHFFFPLLLCLPYREFPLPLLALKKCLDVRPKAAGNGFDHVIGIRRAVDGFLFSRHPITGFRAVSQVDALQAWLDPEFPSESAPAEPWLSDIHGEAELPGAALKCLPGFWRPARLPGKRFVP